MSIQLAGLERYRTHQQLGQTDASQPTPAADEAAGTADNALGDDEVSLSNDARVMEWIARQAPDLRAPDAGTAANLGRLSDHLLRYDLVTLPEAGRLMSLAGVEGDRGDTDALTQRIHDEHGRADTFQRKQEWQKLGRVVSNLTAAQAAAPH